MGTIQGAPAAPSYGICSRAAPCEDRPATGAAASSTKLWRVVVVAIVALGCSSEGAPTSSESVESDTEALVQSLPRLAAIQNADGRLEAFWEMPGVYGAPSQLYHAWETGSPGSWSAPVALGGSSLQLALAKNSDGRLEIFYVGTNNVIYHNFQTTAGGDWSGEYGLGGSAKQLAVGQNADGRLEVVYVGTDDRIYHTVQIPNVGWSSHTALSGSAQQIAIARNADGRLEIFYIGTNNQIYRNRQVAANWNWAGEIAMPGSAKQIVAAQNQDGRLEIFYIGTNDIIYHNWQTSPSGSYSGEAALGGTASQLAVGQNLDGRLEVFYRYTDLYLKHRPQLIPNGDWGNETWFPTALGGDFGTAELAVSRDRNGAQTLFNKDGRAVTEIVQAGANSQWWALSRLVLSN